jgi:hypothetical protein
VRELAGVSMKDLGSQEGNPVRWVATFINAFNAFRSDELQGVASSTATAGNIGVNPFSLAAGDRNTFESDGPPVGFSGDFAWIDFGAFDGSGLAPAPTCGQLSSLGWAVSGFSDGDLAFGDTGTTGDYARGVNGGSAATGGIYAFPVATNDSALGVRPVGADFTPGAFTLRIPNDGITTITSVDLGYRVWVRNDQARGNSFDLASSTDGSSFTTVAGALVTSPDAPDGTPVWVATDRMATVSGLEIPPGGFLFLRWTGDDATGSGSRDAFALDEVVARPTFSACGNSTIDAGETCDNGATNGSTPCDCQWDCTLPAAGTACGGGGLGACDAPDTCDGAGACADRFLTAGTECNASAGPCDVAEACSGTSPTCPADAVVSAGTVCFAADPAAPCDADDVCDGSAVTCPSRVATSGTSCRASTGTCDLGGSCDGAATSCPASTPASSGTACRASTGTCDLGASCDGAALTCPASAPAATSVVCRAIADLCDVAENCDGTIACPVDAFASGTECRAAAGACDVAESCDGSGAACPGDAAAADGTSCGDGTACNGAEVCASGSCGTGTAIDCTDTDLCTADMCTEPAGACSNAAIAGCCNLAADCDDSDVCTSDTCSGPGGTCGHAAISGCCTSDADCSDASACTADSCDTTSNTCVFAPITGCCATDTDCDDGNICTTDSCGSGGTCATTAIAGCCLSDGDCDDSDSCTTDACGTDDMCASSAIADCCATDGDCDDSDVCTTDSCDPGTERCVHAASCDDGGVGDAGMDDAGMDDAGVSRDASVATDAGARDAAVAFDAGVDAGEPVDDGGCSCRAGGRRSSGAPIGLGFLVLGLAFLRRRRGNG